MDLKFINVKSIELEDVHSWDYPDFCDAFISYAEWEDGTTLTELELEYANTHLTGLINELAFEALL